MGFGDIEAETREEHGYGHHRESGKQQVAAPECVDCVDGGDGK